MEVSQSIWVVRVAGEVASPLKLQVGFSMGVLIWVPRMLNTQQGPVGAHGYGQTSNSDNVINNMYACVYIYIYVYIFVYICIHYHSICVYIYTYVWKLW